MQLFIVFNCYKRNFLNNYSGIFATADEYIVFPFSHNWGKVFYYASILPLFWRSVQENLEGLYYFSVGFQMNLH